MTDHTYPTLDAALTELARVRDTLAEAETAYADMELSFKIEAAPVRQRRDALRQSETAAYAAVVDAALTAFASTGDRKPDADATIRLVTRLEYDAAAVIAWALATGRRSLLKITVDEKALTAALENDPAIIDPANARLVTEPKPYVSTRLGHRLITDTP